MSPGIQAKLLRVLQERTIRRLGGQKEQAVDVRLIAATNVDPAKAVQQGKLREDLYYRINVIGICVPPLRDRAEDIPLLVETFITEFNARNGKAVRALVARRDARAPAILVAGQHPRAPQRHRARRHPEPRRVHRGRPSAGRSVRAAAAVDSVGRAHAGHDRGRSRAAAHRADARAYARQQDARGGDSGRHRQDAAQQAEAIPARSRKNPDPICAPAYEPSRPPRSRC